MGIKKAVQRLHKQITQLIHDEKQGKTTRTLFDYFKEKVSDLTTYWQ